MRRSKAVRKLRAGRAHHDEVGSPSSRSRSADRRGRRRDGTLQPRLPAMFPAGRADRSGGKTRGPRAWHERDQDEPLARGASANLQELLPADPAGVYEQRIDSGISKQVRVRKQRHLGRVDLDPPKRRHPLCLRRLLPCRGPFQRIRGGPVDDRDGGGGREQECGDLSGPRRSRSHPGAWTLRCEASCCSGGRLPP
jgi:hypothetical protein